MDESHFVTRRVTATLHGADAAPLDCALVWQKNGGQKNELLCFSTHFSAIQLKLISLPVQESGRLQICNRIDVADVTTSRI